jgi:hypothetical protein
MALSLTWGGRADTNVGLTECFGADHTVAVRFMIQFANIYEGPMLAVHGSGTYFIGCGDGSAGNSKIAIRIGSGSLELSIAQTFQGSWHHVAVVRSGTIGTVYLDGASKGTLALPASGQPSGTLRMGRSDQIHQQFYGFLDDVAIFKAALTAAQVSALASANTLTGNETNLLAGYVFGDGPTAALPATLREHDGRVSNLRRSVRALRRALAAGVETQGVGPVYRLNCGASCATVISRQVVWCADPPRYCANPVRAFETGISIDRQWC